MPNRDPQTIIAQILSQVLGKTIAPGQRVVREEEDSWDSLKHVEIAFSLESAFDIVLNEDEIAAIRSTDDIKQLIGDRHAA